MHPVACSALRYLVITAVWCAAHAWAAETEPDFVLRSWDRRDGLPASVIADIERTPDGYLWLATYRGLMRFDGARFKRFDDQNSAALQTNFVTQLLAEPDGGIWVGTLTSLSYLPDMRPSTGPYSEIGTQLGVMALARGSRDEVWAISSDRTELLRIVGKNVEQRFAAPDGQLIRSIVCDGEGNLVMLIGYNLYTFVGEQFVPWANAGVEKDSVTVIAGRRDGGVWIASGTRLLRMDASGRVDTPHLAPDADDAPKLSMTAMLEDSAGRLWVGTRNGSVHYFHPDVGWRQVTPKRTRALGQISSMHEDYEGMLWIGTVGGFLHQIKPRLVTMWSLPGLVQESVTQTVCVSRDGAVWIGTDGSGAYRYKDGVFARFTAQHGLSNSTVMAIFEDRRTNLWFGTLGGLFRLQGDRLEPELASLLSGQPVPALFEDDEGSLWIGTVGAVIRKRGEDVQVYEIGPGARGAEVRAITQGKEGEIWIGLRTGGLFRFRNERIERETGFERPVVTALHCDDDGVLWIGTIARGLFRFQNGRARNWMAGDGLPSSMVFTILEDDDETLWMSSNEGVFGLRKAELRTFERSAQAPLLAIHLSASDTHNWSAGSGQPGASKGPDGRLWFPLAHGVVSFHPKSLMRTRPELPVLLEEVIVDGVERPLVPGAPIRILSGMRRLEFRYTLADLDAVGRLKFRYKLEGLDEEWVEGSVQRTASYGPLPQGNYRFRVISAGSGNVWREMLHPVELEIVPRIWETGWFRGTSVLLLLGAVSLVVRRIERGKARRRLERLEMQQAMEKERRRIAQDLHDDLGAGLTEIMLLGELAKRNLPAEAQPDVEAMTEKTRLLATAMDEVVWTVNPKNDFVPNLASYIADYAREFFRATPVPCRIDVDGVLPPAPVSAQTRHNLFLAVKEALNNAAKHARATEVWLALRCDNGTLTVSVEDNGRGFDPGAVRSGGNGLQNMRARLEASGGHTEVQSRPGAGTLIRFTVPLHSRNGDVSRKQKAAAPTD